MISRRRFLSLAGLAAGGTILPVACGSRSESQGSGSGGKVTIDYWHEYSESFGGPAIEELVRRFNEANSDVEVRALLRAGGADGSIMENLQAAMASGAPPDVGHIGYYHTGYVADNFPFVSADELSERYGGDGLIDDFRQNVLQLGQANGTQIGLPFALANIITFYNADMLSRGGLDPDAPPETWEAWREAARAIKEETGKPTIWVHHNSTNFGAQAMIESNGGEFVGCQGGEAVAAFAEPESVEAVGFWADAVREGLAPNVTFDQYQQAFLGQEMTTAITSPSQREALQSQASFDLRAAPFPRFGNKEARLPAGGNNLFVFSQDEAKQRAAWRFVEHLLSPEALTIWVKGTGYLPPREGIADDPKYLGEFMDKNPIQQLATQQLTNVVDRQIFPGPKSFQALQVLYEGIEAALGGQSSTEEALQRAAEEVNGLVEGQPCP